MNNDSIEEGQGKKTDGTHLRYASQYKLLLVNSRHVLKTNSTKSRKTLSQTFTSPLERKTLNNLFQLMF